MRVLMLTLTHVLILAGVAIGASLDGGEIVDEAGFSAPVAVAQGDGAAVLINEILASNSTVVPDPQGEYDDWIELYNAGAETVDVAGMYLTDDPELPTKWQIPTDRSVLTTIPPNGYLLIWADGDTGDEPGLHASFRLNANGDLLALYDVDGQTLIDRIEFDDQTTDVTYGRDPESNNQWRFLGIPTPAAPNAGAYLGVVADTKFSRNRGFYDEPFTVTITTQTQDAIIFYTTDGRSPFDVGRDRPQGLVYTDPIPITTTTCLRAFAYKAGWKSTNVDTQTYIFLDDVIRQPARPSGWPTDWGHTGQGDYEMDPDIVDDPRYSGTIKDDLQAVPTLSLVTEQGNWFGNQGIYRRGERDERAASAELIFANERDGFQIDCAVMIVGGSSTSRWKMDKLSMRLKFQGQYGAPRLEYPVFGDDATDEFDTLVIDARMNNSWAYGGGVGVNRPGMNQRDLAQYTRDQFACDIHNAMGGCSPRGRHVHLYLNGLYWGLYWLHERPDEHFAAAYFGGTDEDYDVLKHNSGTAINGTTTTYRDMLNAADSLEEIQGHLDVTDFIDYMLMNYYIGNTDWAHQNWYASRNRTDPEARWHYHSWDAEHSMEGLYEDSTRRNNSGGPTRVHYNLMDDPEYRICFSDRVHKHFFNGGVLTPEGATALYQIRLNEVDRAVTGESARWGDNHRSTPYTRDIDWIRERDYLLQTYLARRTDIVLDQLKSRDWYPNVNPPSFSVSGAPQHGGYAAAGDTLSMSAGSGTIWYTLDGTEPRVPGSTPEPGDVVTLVADNAPKRILIPAGPVAEDWRSDVDFDDDAWLSGTGGVGFERSTGYEQFFDIDVRDPMYGVNATCYIRIPFNLSAADRAGITDLSLKVRYDDGFVAYINGVEVQRAHFTGAPQWNSSADGSHSDLDAIEFATFNLSTHISALRDGANLLAIHGLNMSTTSSDFLISAELVGSKALGGNPAESGVSPTAALYTGPIALSRTTHVKARALSGATWSALNEAVFALGPVAESVRISEIMYHPADAGSPDDPNTEYVELTNVGTETVDLNLVKFTNGIDFTFPSFELAPGDYCLVVRNVTAFEGKYGAGFNIAGQYDGSLNNAGERIELRDAVGAVIHNFRFEDGWFDITDGLGFSLTVKDPAGDPNGFDSKRAWRPSAYVGGSPGYDDTGAVPELGSVVINELLANSVGGEPDWIELHNTTNRPIDLGGWFLSDDADLLTKYEIAAGTVLPASGYLVFDQDHHFGNRNDPGCHERFALSADGETVYLHSGAQGELTGYSEQERFDASDPGVTFGCYLKSTGTYNFVALSAPTPGAANAVPQVGPVVITEIMYHPPDVADAEYVELLNISDAPVTLYDAIRDAPWRFTDDPDDPGIEFFFPADPPVTLAPGEYLVLAKDADLLAANYAVPAAVQVLAWGAGSLSNGSEKIQLSKPGDEEDDDTRHWLRVDRVVYSDGSRGDDFPSGSDPWPAEADSLGSSLTRIDSSAYGNDPANWIASTPSPGS